jgi:hypothetical protein
LERAGSKWQSSGVSGREIAKACLRTRGCLKIESEAFIERRTRPVGLESRFPLHRAVTPADQLSSALQTQNLDLNRSNFQSKHSPEVQSMD